MLSCSVSLSSLLLVLITQVQQTSAGCLTKTPSYPSFEFPEWNNDEDSGVDDRFADCAITHFYDLSFPVRLPSGNGTRDFSCEELIDDRNDPDVLNPLVEAMFTETNLNNVTTGISIPRDRAGCCGAFRFDFAETLEAEVRFDTHVKFMVDEAYPGQQATWATLCEELWACTIYQERYSNKMCESMETIGCSPPSGASLCFGAAYDGGDDMGNEARLEFIIGQCFGAGEPDFDFDASPPQPWPLESLQEMVEMTCIMAEELSQRLNFQPADEELCNELIACTVEVTNEMMAAADVTADQMEDMLVSMNDFDMLRFDLCNGTLEELTASRNNACDPPEDEGEVAFQVMGDGTGCEAQPNCPAELQPFFDSFAPDYPGGSTYEASVAAVRGLGIPNGLSNRTAVSYIANISILRPVAQAILFATRVIWAGLPADWPYAFRVILRAIPAIIDLSFSTVLRTAWYQNSRVNGAELEAAYENTRQLLDGSAATYDQVVCRCAEGNKRRQGCDSRDNDCNQIVDDCAEDQFPPEIFIGQAQASCAEKWYQSSEEAIACAQDHVRIEDDCASELARSNTALDLQGECRDVSITVRAVDECSNRNQKSISNILVDTEDPAVSCGFGKNMDPWIFVEQQNRREFINPNFIYRARDNCRGDLHVQVDIFSSEFEIDDSAASAIFVKNSTLPNAGLYITHQICNPRSNDGCIQADPDLDLSYPSNYRLYTLVVSAKDEAGRSAAQARCHIYVGRRPTGRSRRQFNVTGIVEEAIENAVSEDQFYMATYKSNFAQSVGTRTVRGNNIFAH